MTGNAWHPLTWKDPEFLEFASRYAPDRLNDIVCHADVPPEQRDLFLSRVLAIAHATMIDAQQSHTTILPKQRRSLEALHKLLKGVVTHVEKLEQATLSSIALQAKLTKAEAEKAKAEKAKAEKAKAEKAKAEKAKAEKAKAEKAKAEKAKAEKAKAEKAKAEKAKAEKAKAEKAKAEKAKAEKAKAEKAKGLRLHEPTDWIDENDSIHHRTVGRPTDQKEFQVWASSAIGQHVAKEGEKYVKRAISHVNELRSWTEDTLKNHPPRKRQRPPEVIVRAAVLRLFRVWRLVRPAIPATSRGPFSRFVEAALRPALQGYWPNQRGFESAIDDVLRGRNIALPG